MNSKIICSTILAASMLFSVVSGDASSTTTPSPTTTIKPTVPTSPPTKIDDPNFIPGDFIDSKGNSPQVPPEPPIDILVGFMKEIDQRKPQLWKLAGLISMNGFLFIFCVLLAAAVIAVFSPAYQEAQHDSRKPYMAKKSQTNAA